MGAVYGCGLKIETGSVPRLTPCGRAIGVGDGEAAQNFALEALHCRGLSFAVVIVTQQMQEAVHGQMRQMVRERLTLPARLRGDGFMGEHDVADERKFAADRLNGK